MGCHTFMIETTTTTLYQGKRAQEQKQAIQLAVSMGSNHSRPMTDHSLLCASPCTVFRASGTINNLKDSPCIRSHHPPHHSLSCFRPPHALPVSLLLQATIFQSSGQPGALVSVL